MSKPIKINHKGLNRILPCPETLEKLQNVFSESFNLTLEDVKKLTLIYEDKEKDLVKLTSEDDFKFFLELVNSSETPIKISSTEKLEEKLEKRKERKELKKKMKECRKMKKAEKEWANYYGFPEEMEGYYEQQEPAEKEEPESNVHKGVICDGCNMNPIVGVRYKCSVCPNFDFCENCEKTQGDAHGHPFIKFAKPQKLERHRHRHHHHHGGEHEMEYPEEYPEGYGEGEEFGHWGHPWHHGGWNPWMMWGNPWGEGIWEEGPGEGYEEGVEEGAPEEMEIEQEQPSWPHPPFMFPHGPHGFGPHGFGPHGPHGFGPHGFGPHGFGPHGPHGFGPHGPHGPEEPKEPPKEGQSSEKPEVKEEKPEEKK